jgi:ketosteroid isomerase-like protein
MAPSNSELLEPVYESWGRGEWEPQFDVYADDMEWGFSEDFIESGMRSEIGQKSGRLRAWLTQWDHWRCEAERYIESGDLVIVFCRYTGRGKGSGAPVETLGAHVWKMRDGKAVRLEVFPSRESALAATGIAPDYPSASERTTAS